MKVAMRVLVFSLFAGATGYQVRAADAGDPVFPIDLNNKARAELLYENRQRELDNGLKLKADVFLLRMHTDVGQHAYLDFDVGMIGPQGGDYEFYGGIGLRFLAYDSAEWRISPYAQIHYAPSLEVKSVEYDDLIDADAGLLVAYKWKPNDQLTVMPYAGPALSIIRLSGDVDADEDQLFGFVTGVSLQMPGLNSFRIEAQFFDQVSISASAGISF